LYRNRLNRDIDPVDLNRGTKRRNNKDLTISTVRYIGLSISRGLCAHKVQPVELVTTGVFGSRFRTERGFFFFRSKRTPFNCAVARVHYSRGTA
jgi:hypothetical protein